MAGAIGCLRCKGVGETLAVMKMTDGAMLNAATPMLRRRSGARRVVGAGSKAPGDRLRRLDGDFRRLQVPMDLADHDDVRILAQEGAQREREVQPALLTFTWLMPGG